MTKADVQAYFDKYGDRIFLICINNQVYISVGYSHNRCLNISDITFETIGDEDFLVVPYTVRDGGTEMKYSVHYKLNEIQYFGVMDEGYDQYRPDLRKFR